MRSDGFDLSLEFSVTRCRILIYSFVKLFSFSLGILYLFTSFIQVSSSLGFYHNLSLKWFSFWFLSLLIHRFHAIFLLTRGTIVIVGISFLLYHLTFTSFLSKKKERIHHQSSPAVIYSMVTDGFNLIL